MTKFATGSPLYHIQNRKTKIDSKCKQADFQKQSEVIP